MTRSATNALLAHVRRAVRAATVDLSGGDAEHACMVELATAVDALDAALSAGAALPAAWSASAETVHPVWLAEFRNTAEHTVAVARFDARRDLDDVRDRVAADLGIYFSWMVKDALIRHSYGAQPPVLVSNPAHRRTLADLGRAAEPEPRDG